VAAARLQLVVLQFVAVRQTAYQQWHSADLKFAPSLLPKCRAQSVGVESIRKIHILSYRNSQLLIIPDIRKKIYEVFLPVLIRVQMFLR